MTDKFHCPAAIVRLILWLLGLTLLQGCVTRIQPGTFKHQEFVNYPQLNDVVVRGLGETVFVKGVKTIGPALQIKRKTLFNLKQTDHAFLSCAFHVRPAVIFRRGTYIGKNVNAPCFGPVKYFNANPRGIVTSGCPGGFGTNADICVVSSHNIFIDIAAHSYPLKQDFDAFTIVNNTPAPGSSFLQELLYNGHVGNEIKFTYREFNSDLTRPSLDQDVRYDLSRSHLIGFRELRIKVLSASNTEIRYLVLYGFDERTN